VTARGLTAAWVILPALFVLLLAWELGAWRGLAAERARAAAERARLTGEIRLRERQLAAEISQAAGLGEMQWSARDSDPGAFLNRLAELVEQRRVKVMAIEPLESQSTPQFVKSWHTVRLLAPYREVRDLAARVEGERGLVEDVRIEQPAGAAGPASAPAPADEVQARLRLAVLELSPQARQVLERVAAASGRAPAGAGPLALAVPPPAPPPLGRDPFAFGLGGARAAGGPATAPRAPAPAAAGAGVPASPLAVSGIVAFPDGRLAIVNDQIVGVGGTVNGHRVERITDTGVIVRAPGGEPRTLPLPELSSEPPRAPRR
jgi:hypothetical protein